MNIKELRMWHWRSAISYRNLEGKARRLGRNTAAEVWRKQADFHIKAVQTLNDYISGTAEQDCAEAEANRNNGV